jgi:hypothetical protein
MALRRRSVTVNITSTTAATPTTLLPASSTLTRYITQIIPFNNDTVARQWSLEFGAATLTAANSEPFNETIQPNTGRPQGPLFYGKGRRIDNTAISAFASTASVVTVDVLYDESDTLDA